MICPKCNHETPSVFDFCQNCKYDLREYHLKRDKLIEGTGDIASVPGFRPEVFILNIGPIGGIILMAGAIVWFFGALAGGWIYFYPPVLFVIGLVGFFVSLRIRIKRNKLKKAQEEDKSIRI